VTLLAFAADRRAAVRRAAAAQLLLGACCMCAVQQSSDIACPRGAQQQTYLTLLAIDRWDRQTDEQTDTVPFVT